jgi:hypothetical protein
LAAQPFFSFVYFVYFFSIFELRGIQARGFQNSPCLDGTTNQMAYTQPQIAETIGNQDVKGVTATVTGLEYDACCASFASFLSSIGRFLIYMLPFLASVALVLPCHRHAVSHSHWFASPRYCIDIAASCDDTAKNTLCLPAMLTLALSNMRTHSAGLLLPSTAMAYIHACRVLRLNMQCLVIW